MMIPNNKSLPIKRKPKPSYWRVIQLLGKLRLRYKERNRGEPIFHITIDDFGIVLKFNPRLALTGYDDWDVFDINMEEFQLNEGKFGEQLMWLLIAKGYMAYLRGKEEGNSVIFRRLLITEGWAQRIIDKRLELYANQPRHKFMIEHTKRLKDKPIHYLLMHYPNFFDYLW